MPQPNQQNKDDLLITGSMQILAEDIQTAAESKSKTVDISMDVYNGGILNLWFGKAVVDISGIKLRQPQVKIMSEHGHAVGYATEVATAGNIVQVKGKIVRDENDAKAMQIINKSAGGMIWEASIGVRMLRVEELEDGVSATVNGQEITGPCRIARESEMLEGSIVAFGADTQGTSVQIAARRHAQKEAIMPKENEDKLQGGDQTTMTPDPVAIQAKATPDVVAIQNEKAAANAERIAAISQLEGDEAIKAQAIRENWTAEKTELEVLRASRKAPAVVPGKLENINAEVIEASVRLYGIESRSTVEAEYNADVLERADKLRVNSIKAMIEMNCRATGLPVPSRGASESEWIKAAFFSSHSVSTLVSNVANKVMLGAFQMRQSAAAQVAKRLSASDFKTHTGVRLTGNRQFEKVGPGGELKHGEYSDDSYTYSVDTYGKIFGITRQMLRNDDMGQFMDTVRLLGEGAFIARENGFFTYLLSNPNTIFSSANGNVDTSGAGVDDAGYTLASTLLMEMTDNTSDDIPGAPIMATPDRVLVPPVLSKNAQRMFVSNNLIGQGVAGSTTLELAADANVFKGLYRPVMSPHIGANGLSGGVNTTWYMFAQEVDAFGIAYLDNRITPIIEDAPLSPEYLGQAWRGYFDFGFCTIDSQGAVRMSAS